MIALEIGEVQIIVMLDTTFIVGGELIADTALDIDVVYLNEIYHGTIFTLTQISELMSRYKVSGDCLFGSYFWAKGALIVSDFQIKTITSIVIEIIKNGEIKSIFYQE